MRDSIEVGWSSAAGIASTSERSTYTLQVKRPIFFCYESWSWCARINATKLVVDQHRHDIVATMFGVQNLLMSSPAIFDLDVCVFFVVMSTFIDLGHC